MKLLLTLSVLCSVASFIRSNDLNYSNYVNHYDYLFKNYQRSSVFPTIRSMIFVRSLFNTKLKETVGTVDMFAYFCVYWVDPAIPKWDMSDKSKKNYFTFVYRGATCPLALPSRVSFSVKQYITIRYDGVVFTCPQATHRMVCTHRPESHYPNDIYNCYHIIFKNNHFSWPHECGSYIDFQYNISKSSKDNCRYLNAKYAAAKSLIKMATKDWVIQDLSVTVTAQRSFLTVVLKRNRSTQYANDVTVAVTLGILSSSILLISLHIKTRIFIALFLIFASNIWIRFGLGEQAFVQYSLNENLLRYYQVVFVVQLITLALSCANSLTETKLYSQYQPPQFLVRFCDAILFFGRIDPIFKKNLFCIDGIPRSTGGNEDKTDLNSAIVSATMIGWREVTLIMDRVVFVALLTIVLVTGIVYLK